MVDFVLKINCDNAAFEDDQRGEEVARILREVAKQVEEGYTYIPQLHDYNGNRVGTAAFYEED